ncbi:hypothetical protein L596_015840 [Steinernema carpocapsae]|uniref:Uncharacterized protein n=1 Tax=Steinernema carpocapsae TaxID=34508 RepID=A0A4U5NGT9_STECR|nr:hypothetical protein L596_015840 [Steinernema carpocapsae]
MIENSFGRRGYYASATYTCGCGGCGDGCATFFERTWPPHALTPQPSPQMAPQTSPQPHVYVAAALIYFEVAYSFKIYGAVRAIARGFCFKICFKSALRVSKKA